MNILVVVAHPDDELIGEGASLARWVEEGNKVYCLILSDGETARSGAGDKEIQIRKKQALSAGKIIGFKEMFFEKFPDNQFDTVSLLSIAKKVEAIIEKINPEMIVTHFHGDLNVDHQLTCRATLTACRPTGKNNIKKILLFETLSSTEWNTGIHPAFQPNYYVNVTKTFDKKIKALKEYVKELRTFPYPLSVEAIEAEAKKRGSESGFQKAEAFILIRELV